MTPTETLHAQNLVRLRDDWRIRCVVNSNDASWTSSPSPQRQQLLLEHFEGEEAPATSIVRYEPGASFSEPPLALGEEILLPDGSFSDATGDHGPGAYIRNPAWSSETTNPTIGRPDDQATEPNDLSLAYDGEGTPARRDPWLTGPRGNIW